MALSVTELASKEFILCSGSESLLSVKDEVLKGKEFVVIRDGMSVVKVFHCKGLLSEKLGLKDRAGKITFSDLNSGLSFTVVAQSLPIFDLRDINSDTVVLVDNNGIPTGVIADSRRMAKLVQHFVCENEEKKATILEYEKIFESIDDEIFVTDQNGYVLRLNPAAERVCGIKAGEAIGKDVSELKIATSSITYKVLEQKKKVNMIQEIIKTNKKVLSTAVPVFNENGDIIRIVSTSKDVTEINRLKEELEEKRIELERKNKELNLLRDEIFAQVNFISSSKEMDYIKETMAKIASMDLTVLIQGESGVGKEVIAKTIHFLSKRKKEPFVKINCALIPENLLEAELFGYEGGAFTGANKSGKIGKIELARHGTLFLDEIGEMHLSLQVKMLEFLQDKNICRVGGTDKIEVDTRVLAATNRDLKQMVKDGLFRQDLFYRLNVIPINVPPLRERKEDISVLAEYFLKKFNSKYNLNKRLETGVIEAFYRYEWPGNVRELEHVMERLIVISDSDLITLKHIPDVFEAKPITQKVICYELMPLKFAKRQLEEQLVKTAYNTYKSTYKAAKALEIDQSTVVKILKKYKINEASS